MKRWVRFLKKSWYRISFALILVVPALVCQTVIPVLPVAAWERSAEWLYRNLLVLQQPENTQPSSVAIIEADQKTIDTFGWPVGRSHYVDLLTRLQAQGHPWVLSLLQFQTLAKGTLTDGTIAQGQGDAELASAIRGYGRYIGSGLEIGSPEGLTINQEDNFMPRVALSRSGEVPELPDLPVAFREDDQFVDGQAAFGYATRFGSEPIISCMQFYLTDRNHQGSFLIPSSLVWASAFVTASSFTTGTGAAWPRNGEKTGETFRRRMKVAYKQCLTAPGMLTGEYLLERRITRHSMVDVIANAQAAAEFGGRVVILASSDMRRFRGPGIAHQHDDGIVPEYILAARFLDGLVTGDIIRREPMDRYPAIAWLPLIVAAGFLVISLFVPLGGTVLFGLGTLAGLLSYALINLLDNIFLVPVQSMASASVTSIGLAILLAYLRYHGIRRQMQFTQKLRQAFSQCNTIFEVESLTSDLCKREFGSSKVTFHGFDRSIYQAASGDASAAMAYIDQSTSPAANQTVLLPGQETKLQVAKPSGLFFRNTPFASRKMSADLEIRSKAGHLGDVRLELMFRPYETDIVSGLIDGLRTELTQHWNRIKMLVDQKLLDYKVLMEQTRGNILARFLSQVLVSKFSDKRTMDENLAMVLTPRPARAALMQADIRGYSRVSATLSPAEMVTLLQGYYSNVVDAAQMVAQVKLIGDCIFLFIEDVSSAEQYSAVDLALEIAAVLINETNRQNAARTRDNREAMNFGIAIHYGDVVVGNLSSESCIDYTVIGPNVNLVARLEELTKNPAINSVVGANGLIISPEAVATLKYHREVRFIDINLDDAGVSVRSFPHITKVMGLDARVAVQIPPSALMPARLTG